MRSTGRYKTYSTTGEQYRAFVPAPLPFEYRLHFAEEDMRKFDESLVQIGRLDGMAKVIPDTTLFLYFYVLKEAVLSSQIEGTQSSLSDLILFENTGKISVEPDDIKEVSNYIKALNHCQKRILEGFPLSLRLVRELHEILLASGRGSAKMPGEFRNSQNWIGGTRPGNAVFVPPPPEDLQQCLDSFEKFLHNDSIRILEKIAIAHVQFETIHPFLDGNGRVGRLLITLMLFAEGILNEPILYISLFFKQNRDEYYSLLQNARLKGEWEEWIRFFLMGIIDTALEANKTATSILQLFDDDKRNIRNSGVATKATLLLYDYLKKKPIISIPGVVKELDITTPTAAKSFKLLQSLGIVKEITGKKRDKIYKYDDYIKILSEGTEPFG